MGLAVELRRLLAANPLVMGDGAMVTCTLFARRFTVATLLMLALAGFVASPSVALPITGVGQLGAGGRVVAPPDPCLPPPNIVSFTATPATIVLGTDTTLSWNVQVPSGCNYLMALLGESVALQGSLQVRPLFNTAYTLTLSWGPTRDLYTTATTQVSVNLPTDPADPTRNLVTITSQQMVPMFVRALGTPNTTVILSADLDLTGLPTLPDSSARVLIRDGVRLIGGRTAIPGQPFHAGAMVFITDHPDNLFEVQGDNVRVTGVRISGPDPFVTDSSDCTGILIGDVNPSNTVVPPGHTNVEIDHSEISGWSHAGVRVTDYGAKIVVPMAVDHRTAPAQV